MSITIARYQFEGPFHSVDLLEDRAGVYAIIDSRNPGNHLVDVGESATVKSRVEGHDRSGCWRRHSQGRLTAAVYYTPGVQQAGRRVIEQEIRSSYQIPCGEH